MTTTSWSALMDHVLEEIAAGRMPPDGLRLDDEQRAAGMMRRLGEVQRELNAGRAWWNERGRALRAQEGFLEDALRKFALVLYDRRGLKSFPLGPGKVGIRKAVAVTVWDAAAIWPWLLEISAEDPAVLKVCEQAIGKDHIVKELVATWTEPDDRGHQLAVMASGEPIPGLLKDSRPGQLSVSVKPEGA